VIDQQPGQREVTKMVCAEVHFESVGGNHFGVHITPALLINKSMRGYANRSAAAAACTESRAKSSCRQVTSARGSAATMRATAELPLSRFRTASTTCAPWRANVAAQW